MPHEAAHITVANRNKATMQHLLSDKAAHVEWIATVAFYRALHIAEAIFAVRGKHAVDHGERQIELKSKYPALYHNYRMLWALSTVARYMAAPAGAKPGNTFTTFSEYLDGDVQELVIDGYLRSFETQAKSKLSGPSAKALGLP